VPDVTAALLPEEKTMKTVAIVACSNGQKEEYRSQNEELARYLEETGHKVLWSRARCGTDAFLQ